MFVCAHFKPGMCVIQRNERIKYEKTSIKLYVSRVILSVKIRESGKNLDNVRKALRMFSRHQLATEFWSPDQYFINNHHTSSR